MSKSLSLPKTCIAIGCAESSRAEAVALASCARGEALLELRIDALDRPADSARIIRSVLGAHPGATVLATCRLAANGGGLDCSIERQVRLLRGAAEAGARLVDIEIETLDEEPSALEPFRGLAATIASYHNFVETPPLAPVVRRLERTRADIIKVATMVRAPSDNLRLLALCRDRPNVVVAGMGQTGAAARLLSPARGGLYTYAAPDPLDIRSADGTLEIKTRPTAPGQVTASEASQLYRVASATRDTEVYAVIAKPVGHSKSPLIHNRAFAATGHDGMYVPMLVQPEDIPDFFRAMRQLPICGVSVTIPHKQSVIPYLDSVEDAATSIGAVNTIYWRGGRLIGANTDAAGITVPLERRVNVSGARALVAGYGGAAKAAVVALKDAGATVLVTGRDRGRAARLADRHGAGSVDFRALDRHYFDILVQATPVGMLPDTEGNLFPGRVPADLVFDLVYNPLETALLRHAAAQGKQVISGIEMFVEQAAEQFWIWTGKAPPREVMREAVLERKVG